MGTNCAPLLEDQWCGIHSKASTWEEKISCCGVQFYILIYRWCFIN
jgi:hypothetical protein